MKKILYIHIGTHKTGTTAIQGFSAKNSKELAKGGVFYPFITRPLKDADKETYSLGHHLIPWYLRKTKHSVENLRKQKIKPENLLPSLIEDIKASTCEKVVLSSEEFDQLNKNEVAALKEVFKDFDVKIVVYLRRKDTYLESMYQTMVVHSAYEKKIHDMLKTIKIPQNYYEFITKWRNVFGEENVLVNFYCKKTLKSNDIVVDFFSKLGVNVEGMMQKDEPKALNTSVPFQYVGVMVLLRKMKVSEDMIRSVKRIAYKIGTSANKDFHFLSLKERNQLAESGLEEIKRLNLEIPDSQCFSLSEDEKQNTTKQRRFAALKQIFNDFENYLNKVNKEK